MRKDPRFFVPKHVTNRPKRPDDDDFYLFTDKEFFFNNEMFISIGDDFGRYYGVPNSEVDKAISCSSIFTFNCSIKNLIDLLNSYDEEILICVILSKDISRNIHRSLGKYDEDEKKYRCKEAMKEQFIVQRLISEKKFFNFNTYFVEDYDSYEKMYDNILNDIESKFCQSEMIITKKIFYSFKTALIIRLVKYLNSVNQEIEKFNVLEKNDCFFYTYLNIVGKVLELDSNQEYLKVYKYLISIEQQKLKFEMPSDEQSFSVFTELTNYYDSIYEKKSKYKDDEWQSFIKDTKFTVRHVLNFFYDYRLYIAHGDLHNKNILMTNAGITFIDYDEVCYAPLSYDAIIFVYRYMNPVAGNLDRLKLSRIQKALSKYQHEEIFKTIEFYIIKVILQKKYLEIEGITKSYEWKKDSWILWANDLKIIEKYWR